MMKHLYSKLVESVTLVVALGAFSVSIQAQYRAPQPEKKTPRAVGVLETYKNGSRRLIPVSFYYEKHYYDADLYHATPVPFTLYSDTVYEVEKYGQPLGIFILKSATRTDPASDAWFGNGRFKSTADETAVAKKKVVAPVVVEDPSKPVLHRHEGSEGDNPSAKAAKPAATTAEDEDPDRPRLHKRAGSTDTDASGGQKQDSTTAATTTADKTTAGTTTDSEGQDAGRPKLHRKDDDEGKNASAAGPVVPKAELTPSDDPDHPVLRRGKPVQEQSGRDLPDYKKEEPVLRQVAISDAATSEMQPLIYVGNETERNQLESLARELAAAELRRVAAQRGLVLPGAAKAGAAGTKAGTAPPSGAAGRVGHPTIAGHPGTSGHPAAAMPAIAFKDEQFVPYDLDYSNYATVVYSGRYAPEDTQGRSWLVTVVAREDEGKLVKLYSAVSNPRELDLYPEVRLVDALDPDGYGRAALLFSKKKRDGVSWLIGRPNGSEVQTLFETASR